MRAILTVVLLAVVAVVAYNYGAGRGATFEVPSVSSALERDAVREAVREKGANIADRAASQVSTAANRAEHAVTEVATEATLTPKIKAKLALDDLVKASRINVDSAGSVVTLTGVVGSPPERERALRIARETAGVTSVIDRLHVAAR